MGENPIRVGIVGSRKYENRKKIKEFININNLDGYIIPKNDHYFTEYSKINNLARLTKFTGSAGFALILKKKNYLFVDGRYTIQAKKQAGGAFNILEIPYIWPKNLSFLYDHKIGFDPKLFTKKTLEKYLNLMPELLKVVSLLPLILLLHHSKM